MTECMVCRIAGTLLKYYLYAWIGCLTVWGLLIIASKMGSNGSKFRYYAKYGMIYFATQALTTLYTPFSLFRFRDPTNARIIATTVSYATKLLPITWEVRNACILEEAKGAVVMANHQSSMDIMGLMLLWGILRDVISIAKLEMLYIIPFGPAAWCSGLTFINRKNRPSAMATFKECKRLMTEKGYKMYIYPEGTRNPERGMLPFKKGAFHTAIEAGVPIIPVVFSHMYFIDGKKYIFGPGHVIIKVLDPIPTAGLTKDNLEELIERTRSTMLKEYEKISGEMDDNLANPSWVSQDRPRLVVYEGKKSD